MLRKAGVAAASGGVRGRRRSAFRPPGRPRQRRARTSFVPSARFYLDFSPSFRTTIADAYWLLTVQYYGEHVNGDHRLGLPADDARPGHRLSPRSGSRTCSAPSRWWTPGAPRRLRAAAARRGGAARPTGVWPTMLGDFIYDVCRQREQGAPRRRLVREGRRDARQARLRAAPGSRAADQGRRGPEGGADVGPGLRQGDKYSQQKAVAAPRTRYCRRTSRRA